jgi:hypothetical protein
MKKPEIAYYSLSVPFYYRLGREKEEIAGDI